MTEWIPVETKSEYELPRMGEDVIVTYIQEDEIKVGVSHYDGRGFWVSPNVIAWQPLPQPYERKKGVLEKINEEQDSLLATIKAWDDEIDKYGYVN